MKVGEYEILRKLGEGAFGKVYLARKDAASGFRAYYALKRLRVEHEPGSDLEEYLNREARLGGLVNHPALVRIHEVLRHRDEVALVMDYVDGITLRRIVRRRKGLELPRDVVLEVGAAVLEALHYIHTLTDPEGNAQGFIHRDVKPGNVMLTRQGQLKVMDFGVARLEDDARTLAGELRGTIAYMAPEQARGEPVTAATDQFATGLLILETATGHRAWGDGKAAGVLARVVAGDVSQAMLRLDATDPIAPILMRMLQTEPHERYPTAAAAAHALRVLRAQLGTPPALASFAATELDGLSPVDTLGPEGVPSWTGDNTGAPRSTSASDSWHGLVTSERPASASIAHPPEVAEPGAAPDIFPEDLELDAPLAMSPTSGLSAMEAELEAHLGDADPARTLPLGLGMGIPDIDLGDPDVPVDATLPLPSSAPLANPPAVRPSALPAPVPVRDPRSPARGPAPNAAAAVRVVATPVRSTPPRRRKKAPPPKKSAFAAPWVAWVVGFLLVVALAATTRTVLLTDIGGAVEPSIGGELVAAPVAEEDTEPFDLDQIPNSPTPTDGADGVTSGFEALAPSVDGPTDAVNSRALPEATPQPTVGGDDQPQEARIGVVDDPTPQPTPAPMVEGEIIGRTPPAQLGDYRRAGRDSGEQATPEAGARIGAQLKLLSARDQPLGAPLDLRVRPAGFDAIKVSAYYQWRSEGAGGRRKRTLGRVGGDFVLSLPARELKQDRLQIWFVAEPGDVRLGSATRPLEVRVR